MNKPNKILLAVDFSDYANEALHMGLQLAEANKASAHLLNVLPQINFYDWSLTGVTIPLAQMEIEKFRAESVAILQSTVELLKAQYPAVTFTYEVSETFGAADAIVSKAKDLESDLIILGSHGRKGVDRLLMGSVAEAVLRHAHCGVLIYKKPFQEK